MAVCFPEIYINLRNLELSVFLLFFWFVHKMEHFYIMTPIISFFCGRKPLHGVMEREKEINSHMFPSGIDTFFVCALPGAQYLTRLA